MNQLMKRIDRLKEEKEVRCLACRGGANHMHTLTYVVARAGCRSGC